MFGFEGYERKQVYVDKTQNEGTCKKYGCSLNLGGRSNAYKFSPLPG